MAQKSKTEYEAGVRKKISDFGGAFNAHAHGDRAFTYRDEYYSHVGLSVEDVEKLTLPEKQSLVWAVHTGKAFERECIRERLTKLLEDSIKFGIKRLDSCIDVTYNTRLKSWNIAQELKEQFCDRIEFRLGAYNVAGFKDSAPERFDLFIEAAKEADFLAALAEKDRKPGHIGERQHNDYMLNLGIELGIPVDFHVGQANSAEDRGAELLFIEMENIYDVHHRLGEYPANRLVHDISASCYSENDFEEHRESLRRFNLAVVCCPSAGLSMKQKRDEMSPIHNSLARVWDFLLKDIPVYIGTDNINDVFVPSSTPDMYDEIYLLTHGQRGYNPRMLAKLVCGVNLDNFDKGRVAKINGD